MNAGKKDPISSNPPAKGEEDSATSEKKDWIGANLRKVYDETLKEPVPDKFLALLEKIEKKGQRS